MASSHQLALNWYSLVCHAHAAGIDEGSRFRLCTYGLHETAVGRRERSIDHFTQEAVLRHIQSMWQDHLSRSDAEVHWVKPQPHCHGHEPTLIAIVELLRGQPRTDVNVPTLQEVYHGDTDLGPGHEHAYAIYHRLQSTHSDFIEHAGMTSICSPTGYRSCRYHVEGRSQTDVQQVLVRRGSYVQFFLRGAPRGPDPHAFPVNVPHVIRHWDGLLPQYLGRGQEVTVRTWGYRGRDLGERRFDTWIDNLFHLASFNTLLRRQWNDIPPCTWSSHFLVPTPPSDGSTFRPQVSFLLLFDTEENVLVTGSRRDEEATLRFHGWTRPLHLAHLRFRASQLGLSTHQFVRGVSFCGASFQEHQDIDVQTGSLLDLHVGTFEEDDSSSLVQTTAPTDKLDSGSRTPTQPTASAGTQPQRHSTTCNRVTLTCQSQSKSTTLAMALTQGLPVNRRAPPPPARTEQPSIAI